MLKAAGHTVFIQKNAGEGSGIPDGDYQRAGAELLESIEDIYERAEMIVKVKEPLPAEYDLIRENQIHHIYSIMQTGQAKHGMQTMNQALIDLYNRRIISQENALGHSLYTEELSNNIQKTGARMI